MLFPFSFWQTPISLSLSQGNLIAYYKLHETSGIFYDSAPNKFNLNSVYTVQSVPGIILIRPQNTSLVVIDNAFYCTGNNYLIAPKNISYDITGDKTFAFWLNSRGNDNGFLTSQVIYNGSPFQSSSGGFYLQSFNNFLQFNIHTTGSAVFPTINNFETGKWNFVVAMIKNNTGFLIINNSGTGISSWNTNDRPALSSGFFHIGTSDPSSIFGEGNFYIDEFGIWNRALNNIELNYLYNNGHGRTYPFNI